MDPRYGLLVSLFAALASGPGLAQTTQQGPVSLTPPRPAPNPAPSRPTPPASVPGPSAAAPSASGSSASGPFTDSSMSQSTGPRTTVAPSTSKTPGGMANPVARVPRGAQTAGPQPFTGLRQTSIGLPRTLNEALAATYANQPVLQAERARLRATDENVPTALAGWRPTVQFAASAGYGSGVSRSYSFLTGRIINTPADRLIGTAAVQASQPLYTGGKTQATINHAKNLVMAERATLIAQEQASFTNAVNAYVGVIQASQQLDLNVNNEIVLGKQLQATNDRFRVGEITRTDVAQAEAALAGAQAQRETSEGQLETARGVFQQIIGVLPPADLVPPQPLALDQKDETEAIAAAATNNPTVIAAQFNDAASKDAIDVAFAQLLPQLSLQGQIFQQQNAASWSTSSNGYQVTANLAVPLYQGGSEYSAVRQARQTQEQTQRLLDDARRTAVQNAVSAWETLTAARAAADSTRAQIRANEIALEGVEREAIVGSRTTLDVLNAQQQLLTSRTSLVLNLAQLVNASYAVAAAVGRLTARDMHLPVPLYDETAYYAAVRNKWVGLGDYATNQPGR
jgi:outer membrane protein